MGLNLKYLEQSCLIFEGAPSLRDMVSFRSAVRYDFCQSFLILFGHFWTLCDSSEITERIREICPSSHHCAPKVVHEGNLGLGLEHVGCLSIITESEFICQFGLVHIVIQ